MERLFLSNIFCTLATGALFLIGAAVASVAARDTWTPYALAACFAAVFGMIIGNRRARVVAVSIFALAGALGVLRFTLELRVAPDSIARFDRRTVMVEGIIREEPDRRIAEARYVVAIDRLVTSSRRVAGRVLVKLPRYPEYAYGDAVRLRCAVKLPETTQDGFRYDKYLAGQGIDALCEHPTMERLSSGHGSRFFSLLLGFKRFVASSIDAVWSEPKSSFMAGILYGSRAGLPDDITDLFNKTGVTHIIAVSGSNISIIAVAVMSVLFAIGLHRRQASWAAVTFIVLFVVFTGASASVVRAGIMGGIAILAKLVGRPVRISIVLMATAVMMAIINPYVLMWDAGFQLSFLSTMGLVYVSPLIMRAVPFDRLPKILAVLAENAVTTMAAIIATLPLMLYQFGRLSLVAPVVNVLILWTIPYIMLFGFIATIAGLVYGPLGLAASVPSVLLMEYVLRVVSWFGAMPFAALDFALPLWGMCVLYAFLIVAVVRGRASSRRHT